MTAPEVIAKAKVLLEALPYFQRFRGSLFVVKYGGSFMDDPDPEVRARVALDIVFLATVGIHVVVIHGGGRAITEAMQQSGLEPNFVNGLRVTDEATIAVVQKTLDEKVNREICALVQGHQGQPLGMPGSSLFLCRKLWQEDARGQPIDFGYVGEITTVKTDGIKEAIARGCIPVLSSTAQDESGVLYNTNADSAASQVASALQARRLVYLSDVPGLLRQPNDDASLISSLRIDEVDDLKKSGVIAKGMLPKVESAVRALQNGIHRVHFVDGRMPHSILLEIFTDKGIGTEIIH